MAVESGYFNGPCDSCRAPTVRALKISKTAWMDLYYDLYTQTHGEMSPSLDAQRVVIESAEARLKVLKANGIRT